MPCSRIQRRRARATSARFCSAAYRVFFEADIVPPEETPYRAAAAGDPSLAHRRDDLIQRQIRLLGNQSQQPVRMFFQRRNTPPVGLAAILPVSSQRCSHFTAELALTSKQPAASRRDAPAITASSRRNRKSREQGFGIDLPQKNESMPRDSLIRVRLRIPDSTQPRYALMRRHSCRRISKRPITETAQIAVRSHGTPAT